MGFLALLGFLISIVILTKKGYDTDVIIDMCLDLLTITIPPALPAAMTAGTAFAIRRLKQKKINCISPPRVNVCGRVNLMVFDKTGTLTEDGLTVFGFRGVDRAMISGEKQSVFGKFNSECRHYQPET